MSDPSVPDTRITDETTTHIIEITYHDHHDIAHERRYVVLFETDPGSGQYIAATESYPITTESPIDR